VAKMVKARRYILHTRRRSGIGWFVRGPIITRNYRRRRVVLVGINPMLRN
jgi:hypothetical protein